MERLFIYSLYFIINVRRRYLLQNRHYFKVLLTIPILIRERIIERQNNTFENTCVYFETAAGSRSAIIKGYPKILGPLRVTLKTGAIVDRISRESFSLYLPLSFFLHVYFGSSSPVHSSFSFYVLISFDRVYLVRHHGFVSFLDQRLQFRKKPFTHYRGDFDARKFI